MFYISWSSIQSISSLQVSFYVHRSSVFRISAMFPASLAFLSLRLPRCSPMPEEGDVEPFSITAQLPLCASETPRRSKLIGNAELSSRSTPSFLFWRSPVLAAIVHMTGALVQLSISLLPKLNMVYEEQLMIAPVIGSHKCRH